MMAIMMRNLILIGAILLVSASVSLGGFWKSKNPVSVLNEYLAANVASDQFADNMKAIDKYKPDIKDKEVEQLANLVTNLDRTIEQENLCTGSNLKTLREVIEAIVNYDTEPFEVPKRKTGLNRLVYLYFIDAWEGCGRFYTENGQKENYDRLERIGELEFWPGVDDIIRHHVYRFASSTSDTFLLRGAMRLLLGEWEPSKEELKNIMNSVQLEETSHGDHFSFDTAKEHVSRYWYVPCKRVLDDAQAQPIVGPMTDLANAMVLSGLYRPIEYTEISAPVRWACRNIFCKWVIGKGEDQLAKMIL